MQIIDQIAAAAKVSRSVARRVLDQANAIAYDNEMNLKQMYEDALDWDAGDEPDVIYTITQHSIDIANNLIYVAWRTTEAPFLVKDDTIIDEAFAILTDEATALYIKRNDLDLIDAYLETIQLMIEEGRIK